jgi:hypothetical protein
VFILHITREESFLSTFLPLRARPWLTKIAKKIAGYHYRSSNCIFRENDKDHVISPSSPRVVGSIASTCRGSERIIRVRLPRYLTVELSDIFVLDICVRGEVHGDYRSAQGQRRCLCMMFKHGTYWSMSGSLQLTGGEHCLVTNFVALHRNQ